MSLHPVIIPVHLLRLLLRSQFSAPVLLKIRGLSLQSLYRSFHPSPLQNPTHRKSSKLLSFLRPSHPALPFLDSQRSFQKVLYCPVVHRQINGEYRHSFPPVFHWMLLNMLLPFPVGSGLRSNGSSLSFPLQTDQPAPRSLPVLPQMLNL